MPAASLAGFVISAALSAFGLPLGLPPTPEDPLMAKIAPAECAVYLSWAGVAAPQAGSVNSFEQLLLDAETKRSAAELDKIIERLVAEGVKRSPPEMKDYFKSGSQFWRKAFTQPGAVFAQVLPPKTAGGRPDVRIGIAFKVDDVPGAQAFLDGSVKAAPESQAKPIQIAGRKFYRAEKVGELGPLTLGLAGSYFLMGVGENVVEDMLARGRGEPPAWLTAAKQRTPIARRASILVIDVKSIRKSAGAVSARDAEVYAKLGIDRVSTIESITGLDSQGIVTRTLVRSDGVGTGLLAPQTGPGVTLEDFRSVPAGGIISYVGKIDAPGLYDLITTIGATEGRRGELPRELAQVEALIGMELRKDLLPALGTKVRAWTAVQSIPTSPPAMLFSIDVKDAAKVKQAVRRLVSDLAEAGAPLQREKVGEVDITTLQAAPTLSFTWALLPDRFVFSNRIRLVREQIERPANFQSLADSPELIAALKANPRATLVVAEETRSLYKLLYSLAGIGIPFAAQQSPELQDILNLDALPDPEKIEKHLRPTITTLSVTEEGLEYQTRASVPMLNMSVYPPAAVALLVPAMQAARQAANRNTSINKLKQLCLAIINYESANRRFPPAFSTDASGKPLHSWRVLILPYMGEEEKALHAKLKLMEAWDSPHNLPLLKGAILPAYASPTAAEPSTKTPYQTIRSPNSMFPGKDGVAHKDVKDPSYRTGMILETNRELSVEWYRPDDYVPPAVDPLKGVRGVWMGDVFGIGFMDGHVEMVSSNIAPELLRKIFDRSDGGQIRDEDLYPMITPVAPPRVPRPAFPR